MFNLPEEGPIATDMDSNSSNEFEFAKTFLSCLNKSSIGYHKSLDFSNVGGYESAKPVNTILGSFTNGIKYKTDELKNTKARAFRQFHQTRIYIQGKTNTVKGSKTGEKAGSSFKGIYKHGEPGTDGTFLISANLPENISYRIGSEWTSPLSGLGGPLMSTMAGLLKTGLDVDWLPDSLYNRFQTVQVWAGTKPLNMSITIPVIDDGSFSDGYEGKQNGLNTNFAEALEFLGSLCLPNKVVRDGSGNLADDFGFYTPPPSPLKLTAKWKQTDGTTQSASFLNSNYARIMIQLGGMLLIDNCVITGVQVNYNNTKALIRHEYTSGQNNGNRLDYLTPMIAEVTITFSTIEAITAEDFSKMLWLKTQTQMGEGTVSSVRFQNMIGQ